MVDDGFEQTGAIIYGLDKARATHILQPNENHQPNLNYRPLSKTYRARINPNTQKYTPPEVLCSPLESTPQSELDALRLLDTGRFLFIPSAQLEVRAKEMGIHIEIREERDSIRISLSPDFRDLGQLTGFLSNNLGVGPFLAEAA